MTPLITRIENASGPDRELDAEIALELGLRVVDEGYPLGRVCYDEHGRTTLLPRFTASLDAALTLVPEGWDWAAGTDGFRSGYAHCVSFGDIWETFAATPALALCAAALKARKEMEGC